MTGKELIELSQKNLVGTHPKLKEIAEKIIDNLASVGVYFGVHMGLRSWATQDALYSQGRDPLTLVNAKRLLAGLGAISAAENLKKVTKAAPGKSFHNYGLATDLVEDGDPNRAGIQWSWASTKNYLKIGKEAKNFPEIEWGGAWKSIVDVPHIELHGDITISAAGQLYRDGGIPAVWAAVEESLGL